MKKLTALLIVGAMMICALAMPAMADTVAQDDHGRIEFMGIPFGIGVQEVYDQMTQSGVEYSSYNQSDDGKQLIFDLSDGQTVYFYFDTNLYGDDLVLTKVVDYMTMQTTDGSPQNSLTNLTDFFTQYATSTFQQMGTPKVMQLSEDDAVYASEDVMTYTSDMNLMNKLANAQNMTLVYYWGNVYLGYSQAISDEVQQDQWYSVQLIYDSQFADLNSAVSGSSDMADYVNGVAAPVAAEAAAAAPANTGANHVDVPIGEYIVGEHIPAGIYVVSCASGDDYATKIQVYTVENGQNIIETQASLFASEGDVLGQLTLEEGERLKVSDGQATIAQYQ